MSFKEGDIVRLRDTVTRENLSNNHIRSYYHSGIFGQDGLVSAGNVSGNAVCVHFSDAIPDFIYQTNWLILADEAKETMSDDRGYYETITGMIE